MQEQFYAIVTGIEVECEFRGLGHCPHWRVRVEQGAHPDGGSAVVPLGIVV